MNELDLFAAAIAITDPDERAALLERECAGRPELRLRLDQLLDAHFRPEPLLDRPGFDQTQGYSATEVGDAPRENEPAAGATLDRTGLDQTRDRSATGIVIQVNRSKDEQAGVVIAGKYTLVEIVGEGGMGSVWRARQTVPVKRFVAVKLIKAGMDSRQVLARFDAERQALALMDHPNIAKVLDGGLHEQRPYFVMELVKGVPITEYCDARRLTPRERLELFVPVCQAIQHAHQKGIIHRDIKPSNVLIALYDDKPVVKVIDFGVAKATGGALTEHTIDTGFGGVVGTPQYMSPEQATFNNLDIDTRSDIYALGVLLYELLTGSPPFSKQDLEKRGVLEMLRVVREEEPPRPSTKLSTADALPSLSASRNTEPSKLTGLLRNELDWVVMKALEKDRSRRYETANGFAADVQRYLNGDAVHAHPPSAAYRLKKFVRKHNGQVIAASLLLLALLSGIAGTTYGLFRAQAARKAEANQRDIAVVERDKAIAAEKQTAIERDKAVASETKAREEAAKSKAINDFLTKDLLTQAEPANNAVEDKVTLVEVLDRAAEKVGTRFADQSEIEQSLRSTIAQTYHGLAFWEKAETQYRAMLDAARKHDPDSSRAYVAQGGLAHILQHRGRRDAEFLELAESAARGLERTLGPDNAETIATLSTLAKAYLDAGKLSEAIALCERIRDAEFAKRGANTQNFLIVLNNLASAYRVAGRLTEAIALYERVRDAQIAKLGPDHPDTLATLNNLAMTYLETGKRSEAIALFERVRDAETARLGPDHPNTLGTLNNLAGLYVDAGRVNEAIPLFERIRNVQIAKLGPDHQDTLRTTMAIGIMHLKAGRFNEAIPLYERLRDAQIATLGPDHPDTLITLANLAGTYMTVGKLPEAIAMHERIRDAQAAKLGSDHPATLTTLFKLAALYGRTRQFDKSVPLFEDVLKRRETKLGRQHPDTQGTVAMLGVTYHDAGRTKEAIPLLEEANQAAKRTPALRFVSNSLIDAYMVAGENAKLADFLKVELPEVRKSLPKDSPDLASVLAPLGLSLLQQKKWSEAEPILREALAIREQKEPEDWRTFNTKSLLGGSLLGQKKYAEAEPLLLAGYEGMKQREMAIPPQGIVRFRDSIDRLIELYNATNRPEEVKKYQAERAKFPDTTPEGKK